MNSHGLTKENLLAAFPQVLRTDRSVLALAEALAEVLAARREEIDRLRIYPAIDRLDEQLLDILAHDFKVDWWDADYSLEEKRRTLKDSWRVHRLLGTKAAVETAIRAIYPGATVVEWWEYGGEPYCFRLCIPVIGGADDQAKQQRVLARLNTYKNLRSHLDGITTEAPPLHRPLYITPIPGRGLTATALPELQPVLPGLAARLTPCLAGSVLSTRLPALPENFEDKEESL